jgi:hypothetical protein
LKKFSIILLLVIFVSCNTVYITKQQQKIASSALELATIGIIKPNLQINNFEVQAIPKLNQKIKVNATLFKFNKSTYKAFNKANKLQGDKNKIEYIDSIADKPAFLVLDIVDKVSLLKNLKEDSNVEIINYLKYSPKAKIITTVTMVFDTNTLNEIKKAEEIYLSAKKYNLELYKNNKLVKTIALSKGMVFSYKLLSFCWGENDKHQIELIKLIDNNTKCNNNTYNNYEQFKSKKAYIKF